MDHQAFAQLLGNYGEFIGAIAVVVTLGYLAMQVRYSRAATETSNRLARAEALRSGSSSLVSLNAAFCTDPTFRHALGRILYEDAVRSDLSMGDWVALDGYLVSVTDILEQIYREVREGILGEHAIEDFTALGLFELPYYRTSWHTTYKRFMSPSFIEYFEARYNLVDAPSKDGTQIA